MNQSGRTGGWIAAGWLLLMVWGTTCLAQPDFRVLDSLLQQRNAYVEAREAKIGSLHEQLRALPPETLVDRFSLLTQLHEAWFNFDFDSAIHYSGALRQVAAALQVPEPAAIAGIRFSATIISAGLFGEGRDSLASIRRYLIHDSLRVDYFYWMARSYFDMADLLNQSKLSRQYVERGILFLDSALQFCENPSLRFYSLVGLRAIKAERFPAAVKAYEKLFGEFRPTGRQLAIDASTYAYALSMVGRKEDELQWLTQAAITDVQIANRENIALRLLANRLYDRGDLDQASRYLDIALDDARRYGASQRERQISLIQPEVEASRLTLIESQRNRLRLYAVGLATLVIIIILMMILLYRQLRQVRLARDEIRRSNEALRLLNAQLTEANLIKEAYFTYFFRTNSDLLDKLNEYRLAVDHKVQKKDYLGLTRLLTQRDMVRERNRLLQLFDEAFLDIFPAFISAYNALFSPQDQSLNPGLKELNTDARIFALIRLGITNVESIAQILGYSVNTIHTYKTRVKNLSTVANEDFEPAILAIPSL